MPRLIQVGGAYAKKPKRPAQTKRNVGKERPAALNRLPTRPLFLLPMKSCVVNAFVLEIFYIYGNNTDPDEPNLEVHRDFFLSSQDYSTGISSKMNIPALATGEQALRWLRLVCEPMRRTSLGLMSVRVTNDRKKKKQDFCPAFCRW